jgi:periplasmic divalent cation tolerance protein
MKTVLIYMTTADKAEARDIGAFLVHSKLAACVNILDHMNSMYVWQGQFREDEETVLLAKTTEALADQLIEAVRKRHSYDCPCIVTLPITAGNPDFIQWICDQVKQ